MRSALKFVMALIVTILLMLAFRALVFTVYTVSGSGLEPCFVSGDRVLVNRWSYGPRTGGGPYFRYTRWMPSPVERGDLVAFNCPADSSVPFTSLPVSACYCTGVPGDTVMADGVRLMVPGRDHIVKVSESNMRLLCFLYNRYEGRNAEIADGRLIVDGTETRCAAFGNDYYWFSSGRPSEPYDSRFFGFVPETHIIGKVSVLLYSVDPSLPFYECLRPGRNMQLIRKPRPLGAE